MKKLLSLTFNTLLAVAIAIAALFIAGHFGYINFYTPFLVLSGSMEPAVKTGSIVLTQQKPFGYMIGDIITFKTSKNATPTTHRISALEMKDGQLAYQTKGDANNAKDSGLVLPGQVIGSVQLTIPHIGYAADYAGKPQGFIALVIIPATIIIYEELKTMLRQSAQELSKLRRRKKPKPEPDSPLPSGKTFTFQNPHKNHHLGFVIVPAIAITLISPQLTKASFADLAQSIQNIFAAASDFGQPIGGGDDHQLPAECTVLEGAIDNIIIGDDTSQNLTGTSGNDLIFGLGGADNIEGKGGQDCLIGGDGDDSIRGNAGADIILGGPGNDDLRGNNGDDILYGDIGEDTIKGNNGRDLIFGGHGADDLDGNNDRDEIHAGPGNDSLDGSGSEDQLFGDEGNDAIKGGGGDDFLDGGADIDSLDGDGGTDTCVNGEAQVSCEL